jgi:hypothetical protein
MDQETAEIIRDIEEDRLTLGDRITELERKLKQVTDWRSYYARNVWRIIGAAFFLGMSISRIIKQSQ